jgi:hypothetical protein
MSALVNNGLILIIVKTRPSIKNNLRKSQIQIAKCNASIIYAVTDIDSIEAGIDFLLKMAWHKPIFHMLIGRKGLDEKIFNSCKTANKDIEIVEKEFESDILCYIDPLDDQLEFYAEGFVKEIIINAFPSLAM